MVGRCEQAVANESLRMNRYGRIDVDKSLQAGGQQPITLMSSRNRALSAHSIHGLGHASGADEVRENPCFPVFVSFDRGASQITKDHEKSARSRLRCRRPASSA